MRMLKLTSPNGKPFYVNFDNVEAMRVMTEKDAEGNERSWTRILCSSNPCDVKEPPERIMALLNSNGGTRLIGPEGLEFDAPKKAIPAPKPSKKAARRAR